MSTEHAVHYDAATAADDQFLTFRLSGQDYGIPILKVQEIKGWNRITPLPNSPSYIKGVLNLRGKVVPVIDLRLRFNLAEVEHDAATVVIVVNVNDRLAGLMVDSVSDVVNVNAQQRCISPEFEGQANRQFIASLAEIDNNLLIILDVDKLIYMEMLANAAEAFAKSNNQTSVKKI